jgi:hypothetical protein
VLPPALPLTGPALRPADRGPRPKVRTHTRSGPARSAATPRPTARAAIADRVGPLHPTRPATAAKAPRKPQEPAPAPEGLRPPPPGAALDAAPGGPRGPSVFITS